ncbi:MAG: DUF3352 domain-containing protein [Phycisphaerales bacterium]|nr:DUF3352 domain-containing protein [Phycisphaerales bacterium]MCB9857115.1 DUF3352 domain-containing protein [Phycisphaerales bacterium]MCB9861758.1 DUF3352 domain-containing protein [Phycisphaerales bacterium]
MSAIISSLLALLLFQGQVDHATSRPAAAESSGSRNGPRANLLEAVPVDASLAIIADLRGESIFEDMLKAIARSQSSGDEEAEKYAELLDSIPGEIAIGIAPDPRTPDEAAFVVVMDVTKPGFDFRDWLDRRLLPVLRMQGRRKRLASLRIEGDGGAFRIVNPHDDNKSFAYVSVRGGTAVLANRANLARTAAAIRESDKSFADAPGIRRILRDLPKDAPIKVLFNPAPILKAQKPPKKRSPDELLQQILHPEDLVAAGGFIRWRGRTVELGACAQLADECKGIAQWFDRPDTESTLMRELAGEFPVLFRIGLTSLTALPDGIYKITDNLDETISTEYREDLADFNKTTGIDFNAAVLGQIREEMAIAVRPDFSKQPPVAWTLVARIQNAETLENACAKLAEHFDLAFDARTSEGITIRSTPQPTQLAWCIVGNRLVVADSFATVRDVARHLKADPTGKKSEVIERGTREIGAANQMMLLTDVGLLCRQAPMLPALAGPRFSPLLSGGYLGASVTRRDRGVHLNVRWELGGPAAGNDDMIDSGADQLIANLTENLAASLAVARHQRQRIIGMTNLRSITQSFYIYAQDHGDRFPESIEALAAENPDLLPLALLANPYTQDGPESPGEIAEYGHVLYRPGLTPKSAPDEILLAEKSVQAGIGTNGANFSFVDGHCEFIEEPVAGRLIEMIQAGEPIVTVAAATASLDDSNAP